MTIYPRSFDQLMEMWNVVVFMALLGAISFPLSVMLVLDIYGQYFKLLWEKIICGLFYFIPKK